MLPTLTPIGLLGQVASNLEYESLQRRGLGCGSGLVGVSLKSRLGDELPAVAGDWLTLGGAVPPAPTRPQMSKHQNTENKRHS